MGTVFFFRFTRTQGRYWLCRKRWV